MLSEAQLQASEVALAEMNLGGRYFTLHAGTLEVVQAMIDGGASLTAIKDKETPLNLACKLGKEGIVAALLAAGAEPNQTKKDGGTALMAACHTGQLEVVQSLLDAGAIVNMATTDGTTAFGIATVHGHKEVAALLTKAAAEQA